MSMTDKDRQEQAALEAFFAAAQREAPAPSPELLARVLAQAEAEQARFAPPRPRQMPRLGLAARLRQGLGGWPALAGLAAAGLAGVWIGLALPEVVIAGGEADYLVDVAPDIAFDTGGDF